MPNYRKDHDPYPDLALGKPADPTKVLARFRFGTYEFLSYEAAYYNFRCSLHAFYSTGYENFVTAADFGLLGSSSLGNSPLCERILNSLRFGVLPDAKDYLVFTMCTTDGQVSPTMQPVDFDSVGVVQEVASLVSSFIATASPHILDFFLTFSARSRWSFNGQLQLQLNFNPPPLDLKKLVPSSACIEDTGSKQFVSLGNHWTSTLGVFSCLPFIPRLSQAADVPHIAENTSYHVPSTITLDSLMQAQGICKVSGPSRKRKRNAEPTPEPTLKPVAEPTPEPTPEPTLKPVAEPTPEPTPEPEPADEASDGLFGEPSDDELVALLTAELDAALDDEPADEPELADELFDGLFG